MGGSDERKEEDENKGLQIAERKLGKYECPSLILSEEEERRIGRP